MYVYEDMSKLISLIKNGNSGSLYVYIEPELLDSSIDNQKLFMVQHVFDSDIKSIFSVIDFLKEKHGYDRELNNIYMMIGRVSQKLFYEGIDNMDILESYMHMYLSLAYRVILNKDNPTMKDIFDLYGITPIRLSEDKGKKLSNSNE